MNKITADHLARRACVYIRQSTPEQVRHNLESKRRQYGLVDRARALGWQEIDVIDDDLGISGSGIHRPGFERLLAAVCDGQVGAVFSIEASRLARTNREWHTLLEFCSIVGVLLIDAEAVYDPRLTNDRLLSGMKGTISEMEVASFRERAQAAIRQKAQRGALIRRPPIGYVKGRDDRLEKDPDARVRSALDLVFRKSAELGSVRKVFFWLDYYRMEYEEEKKTFEYYLEESQRAESEKLDGSYLLKTDREDLSAEEAWRIYTLLTRAEAAFRALKSPLAERPIFHHKECRVEAHIFLCVLAYHLLTAIEKTLLDAGYTPPGRRCASS